MAPDKVYPDVSRVPPTERPPSGAYYSVKDQQIPPPATYHARGRRRSSCCCCVIWLFSLLAIFLTLIGLAVLIFWLVVHPKAPQFDVETVHISGLNGTSPFNVTIEYGIKARNPNKKMSFYYSNINVKVEASGNVVGQGTVSGFSQGHKNITYVNGEINSQNVSLSSSTLAALLQNSSNVPFYAEVDFKVKVKVGGVKTSKMKIKVKCDIGLDLTVGSGSQLKSSKCKVHW